MKALFSSKFHDKPVLYLVEDPTAVPDETKDGGAYKTVTGCFKRVDAVTHDIILSDGTVIPAAGLYSLDGEIFKSVFE